MSPRSRLRALVPMLLVLALVPLPPAAAEGDPSHVVLEPAADTYVHEWRKDDAFGGSWSLGVYGSPEVTSLLRFDLPAAPDGQVLQTVSLGIHTSSIPSAGSDDAQEVRWAGDDWVEDSVTWPERPAVSDKVLGTLPGGSTVESDYRISLDPSAVKSRLGTEATLAVTGTGHDSLWFSSRNSYPRSSRPTLTLVFATASPPSPSSRTVMAVGDIACAPHSTVTALTCRQADVATVVKDASPDAFIALGDLQYSDGTYAEFTGAGGYDDAFGPLKARTLPVVGNHEYRDPAGAGSGYFDYFYGAGVDHGPFGDRPDGYYARMIGSWQFIALNSECNEETSTNAGRSVPGGCDPGSPQYEWLRSVLASSTARCTLVAFHRPRWTTGAHLPYTPMAPMWDLMAKAGVDVTVSGHNHVTEVFAPIGVSGDAATPDLDPNGIRSFVAGSGGKELSGFRPLSGKLGAAVQARDRTTFGPLQLTLHKSSFDWSYQPVAGGSFTGSGTDGAFSGSGERCH